MEENIQDRAGPLLQHCCHRGLCEVVNSLEVGVDHRIPVGLVHAYQQLVTRDAGVVDQHVRSFRNLGPDLFDRFGGTRALGGVRLESDDPGPSSAISAATDLLWRVCEGNLSTLGCDGFDDGATDSTRSTGHDGNFTG